MRRAAFFPKIKFAGGSPAASHFLLSRQEKVTKEKATQVRRPFGLPCGTRPKGPLRNSPLRGSDSARGILPFGLRSSADAQGPESNFKTFSLTRLSFDRRWTGNLVLPLL